MRPFAPNPDDPDPQYGQPPGGAAVTSAITEDVGDEVDRIQQLVRELDIAGGIARIHRQAPGRSSHDYVGEMDVDGFSLEKVKQVYGGGHFKVRFSAATGRYVKQIAFSIDPSFRGEIDRQPTPSQPAMPQPAPGDVNGLLMMMIKAGEDRAARAEQAARDASERAAQMQAGMLTTLVTMMVEAGKANAQVMAAVMGREPRDVTPTEPGSRLLEAMMPLLVQNAQPRHGLTDLVETVKVVRELSTSQQDAEPEKEDMLDKVMKVGAPILGAIMARGQPMPTVPVPVPQPQPQPQPQKALPAQDDAQQAAEAKVRSLIGQLRVVTPVLVKAAARNAPIESYMDILDDTLDDESWAYLVAFLQRDDWVSTLFGDNPGVVRHKPWFDNFREMVLHEGEEEADSQGPDAGSAGQPGMVP